MYPAHYAKEYADNNAREYVESVIKKGINGGHTNVYINEAYMRPSIKTDLLKLGYRVEQTECKTGFEISWG